MKNLLRFILFPLAAIKAVANPTGLTVQSGAATAVNTGTTLNITAAQNAFLNWEHFNIAAGEKTVFNQPSANSIVWNKINDANPSQIYGSLQANGVVVLMNSAGFNFGPNSFVSAAGLVVSTANCVPPQNYGGTWEFNGPPALAKIVNYGRIEMAHGGSAFLIADQVENHGSIEAPGGSIGLAAGQTVLLNDRPDGRGLSMAVTLPQGSVNNYGNLVADGGSIALQAKVVNQSGLIQANSVREQNGDIELVAADTLNLGASSQISAHGDDTTAASVGGTVTLKSDNVFSDAPGSQITTAGGAQGGNGGNVEVSAPDIQSFDTAMDASAAAGATAGQLLLDPININLVGSGTSTTPAPVNGTVDKSASGTGTLTLNVNTAFQNKNFSAIKLEASGNISLAANLTWDLSGANGYAAGTQLSLLAGGNITFGNGSSIIDENNWAISLLAGVNNFTTPTVRAGTGSIFLNGGSGQTGGGSLVAVNGNISLLAGSSIQMGSGTVKTTGAGNIALTAPSISRVGITVPVTDSPSVPTWQSILSLLQGQQDGSQNFSDLAAAFTYSGGNLTYKYSPATQTELSALIAYLNSVKTTVGGTTVYPVPEVVGTDDNGDPVINTVNFPYVADLLAINSHKAAVANLGTGSTTFNYSGSSVTLSAVPFSQINSPAVTVATTANITVDGAGLDSVSGTLAPLDLSTASGNHSGQLNLLAGGNLVFSDGAVIQDENNWSVTLRAGVNNFTTGTVAPGTGSLLLNGGNGGTGSGTVQTAQGNITLAAGLDLQICSGGATTTGGGNITASAANGNVLIGTDRNDINQASGAVGFYDQQNNRSTAPTGISTGAGGDVKITAGGNVFSYMSGDKTEAGSGTFGSGNVTVIADGNISGHFVCENGVGALYAGYKPDSSGNPVADATTIGSTTKGNVGLNAQHPLALSEAGTLAAQHGGIPCGWTVTAQNNILLQEVRNPQGIFNYDGSGTFNYALDSYATLKAGNEILLDAGNLVRPSGSTLPEVLPPVFSATAGAGGILIQDNPSGNPLQSAVYLYPSALGQLSLTTLNGGNLASVDWDPTQPLDPSQTAQAALVMSDSDNTVFTTAGDFTQHAATPLHKTSSTPVTLDISGNLANIYLSLPEAATIHVHGNMYNSSLIGQNVNAGDTTALTVDGSIKNFDDFDSIPVSDSVDLTALSADLTYLANHAMDTFDNKKAYYSDLIDALQFSPGYLTFQCSPAALSELKDLINYLKTVATTVGGNVIYPVPEVQVTPNNTPLGKPETDSTTGDYITKTVNFPYFNDLLTLQTWLNGNGSTIPAHAYTGSTFGIQIGGGGTLKVTAGDIQLGSSPGIQSIGPGFSKSSLGNFQNANLKYLTQGASLDIVTTGDAASPGGDISMVDSTISTWAGGNINVSLPVDVPPVVTLQTPGTATQPAVYNRTANSSLTAGSTVYTGDDSKPRGIFTVLKGDVTVIAANDINLNNSRIAAYDGGNVTVKSLDGNVNAGNGGTGSVGLDAVTFNGFEVRLTIPGSGILATTLPSEPDPNAAPPTLGNIFVETPKGTITASKGGIIQVGFNNVTSPNATVLLLAGLSLVNNAGDPLTAADFLPGFALKDNADKTSPIFSNLVDAQGNVVGKVVKTSPTDLLAAAGIDVSDPHSPPFLDASGSGVIAQNAILRSEGNIDALVLANNADISAQSSFTGTVLASGQASISAGQSISGTIIGVGGVSASGSDVTASLLSQNVSGSTSGEKGFSQGTAANSASQGQAGQDTTKAAKSSDDETALDDKKKKGKNIALAQKVSRVTVILPSKN